MSKSVSMKVLGVLMAVLVAVSVLTGCGAQNSTTTTTTTAAVTTTLAQSSNQETSAATTTTTATSTEMAKNPESEKFVLEYPEDMKELGFVDPLVLEKKPVRVVSLTVAPVPALMELGVKFVGLPTSRVVSWPEEMLKDTALVKFNPHSPEDFDFESLVVLEPDLVIVSSGVKDTAGKKLVEEFNLPVYYVQGGHTVKYASVKSQTAEFVKAFGKGDAAAKGEEIMKRFVDLEAKVEKSKAMFEGKSVMVIQSGGDRHFIQTNGGTLGSMLEMLGFVNVFENKGNSMVQLDLEQALSYNPDFVVCVGGGTSEEHKAIMEKVFAENPDYWNSIAAIKDGKVQYLGIDYIANTGIHVVGHIEKLVEYMTTLTGGRHE
ncbi:MAG: ABC transporter substrate-binding protein [Bacillota bacterium]|nr:ABC transporter substrate-binding protein [Bacillota bacterium]